MLASETVPSRGLKAIAIMGIGAFVLLLLAVPWIENRLQPNSLERVVIRGKNSPFDAARVRKDLETVVGFGPRTAGSEASGKLRAYLKRELVLAGLEVLELPFVAETPIGTRNMVNLVAEVRGTRPGVILFGNHYDTKYFPDFTFVGANDGGSSTAWMLEMARIFGPRREGRSIWLVWFDGEESFGEWSDTDGLYGSRQFVAHLRGEAAGRPASGTPAPDADAWAAGAFDEIAAMINVDMIGDCFLRILKDRDAPDWLSGLVWNKAEQLGYGAHFSDFSHRMIDDHVPFQQAGVPALEIIDFSYGGSMLEHRKNWHTAEDVLDKVCVESLQAVADVIYHALPAIEGHLDTLGNP